MPSNNKATTLNIVKDKYVDTVVVFVANKSQSISISLGMRPKELINSLPEIHSEIKQLSYDDSIITLPSSLWTKLESKNVNLVNIKDTILSTISISLIPPISTNKLLSFNTKNTIGINLIGGYSKGIDVVEVGGVYNLDYGDVKYVQAAGVVNIVSGSVKGVQAAGVANLIKNNIVGVQLGGVMNYTKNVTGVQAAGAFNQNVENISGVQVSGAYNKTNSIKGVQVAGAYNKASKVNGVQVSGLLNYADTVTGFQIGIINISRKTIYGLPIGLFNYVKDGYHKAEYSYDDLGFHALSFRSGQDIFHSYIKAGYNSKISGQPLLQGRYGIGSSLKLRSSFRLELDASSGSMHKLKDLSDLELNVHNQFLLGFSFQPSKKFGIRSGLTFNHLYYDSTADIAKLSEELIGKNIYQSDGLINKHKLWFGYQVSVLLF
jgi:hypothetical protein